jgi:hypothetical protein
MFLRMIGRSYIQVHYLVLGCKVTGNALVACMRWIRKGEREAVRALLKVELVLVKARASDGTRVCWLEWKERLYRRGAVYRQKGSATGVSDKGRWGLVFV